jgi:hypothetical protein
MIIKLMPRKDFGPLADEKGRLLSAEESAAAAVRPMPLELPVTNVKAIARWLGVHKGAARHPGHSLGEAYGNPKLIQGMLELAQERNGKAITTEEDSLINWGIICFFDWGCMLGHVKMLVDYDDIGYMHFVESGCHVWLATELQEND